MKGKVKMVLKVVGLGCATIGTICMGFVQVWDNTNELNKLRSEAKESNSETIEEA